jgi:hypothetical protein
MINISLVDNASLAYKNAEAALKRIMDGEANSLNYRNYILNLHSAYELFLKHMLMEKNQFMLFDFSKYSQVIDKYKKAKKNNMSIFEYVSETPGCKLPNTVTFLDAVKRLAYLYNEDIFDEIFINQLGELNDLRNMITHYEIEEKDEKLYVLNELFIKCEEIYSNCSEQSYAGSIDFHVLRERNKSILDSIIKAPYNKRILNEIDKCGEMEETCFEPDILADILIENHGFDKKDRAILVQRINLFDEVGLFDSKSAGGEHVDVTWCFLRRDIQQQIECEDASQ